MKIFVIFIFPAALTGQLPALFLRLASLALWLTPHTDGHRELVRRPDAIPAPPVRPFGHR